MNSLTEKLFSVYGNTYTVRIRRLEVNTLMRIQAEKREFYERDNRTRKSYKYKCLPTCEICTAKGYI